MSQFLVFIFIEIITRVIKLTGRKACPTLYLLDRNGNKKLSKINGVGLTIDKNR